MGKYVIYLILLLMHMVVLSKTFAPPCRPFRRVGIGNGRASMGGYRALLRRPFVRWSTGQLTGVLEYRVRAIGAVGPWLDD